MRNKHSGFSMIELLVVIAIIMVIAAMATPSLMNTMNGIRLRSAASEVAGIMQECRQRAVRNNRYYTVKPTVVTGARAAYVDLNYNDTFDAGAPAPEPMIQIPQSVTVVTAGAPNTANLIGQCCTTFVPQNAATLPSFNSRGLPCVGPVPLAPPTGVGGVPNSVCNISSGGQTVGFVYYMNQTRAFGAVGWAAVSVTPAGRIRVWTYSGATWQ
jgi:prepilin-type N-terminal cleavage/methylation domain-containing protein